MIGSQCVHAATDAPPTEVLMSRECDILLDDSDPLHDRIDAELGEASPYHAEHGTYVDTVLPRFRSFPSGGNRAPTFSNAATSRSAASSFMTSCCPSSSQVGSRTTS